MSIDTASDPSKRRATPAGGSGGGFTALMRFLRRPSLARSVVVLLTGALVLLLVVNF
ncbi:MAG: hypothetical protein JWR59_677, partial [Brevundimonas sp.]|nr:hypothetical protein [Brevundimonas sp.]